MPIPRKKRQAESHVWGIRTSLGGTFLFGHELTAAKYKVQAQVLRQSNEHWMGGHLLCMWGLQIAHLSVSGGWKAMGVNENAQVKGSHIASKRR